MMSKEISEFGYILLFIIGGILFVLISLGAGWLLRPNRPNEEKLSSYESGEEAKGSAWALFNPRFYIVAITFVLFEVEIVFLFPWATVFGQKKLIDATAGVWGWFTLMEMLLFVFILAIGFAYVWKKGLLDWEKPVAEAHHKGFKVPEQLYQAINKKYENPAKKMNLGNKE